MIGSGERPSAFSGRIEIIEGDRLTSVTICWESREAEKVWL